MSGLTVVRPLASKGRRKWQEFYQCECDTAWWGWSDDRPPSGIVDRLKDR